MTQESGDQRAEAGGGRDRTHVWTCVDVSVCVLVPQLGSGREAESGSEGQAGLGSCLGAERETGTRGTAGCADWESVCQG